MDLVKIGFVVSANGLKDANTEVDKLLNRVDKIGSGSKKNASDFENSQKRIKDSSKSTTNEVDKTTKALERQRLTGEYLAKGLDRTTASAIASFRQLGGTTAQVNALMTSLANNKGIVQAQKDTAKLTREQGAQAKALERQRIIGEYLGKGLDKTTASAIASFRQLGGTIAQVNTLMSSLASNKALVQAQKDTAKLTREQGAQAKAVQTTLANFKQLKAGVIDTNTVFTLLGNNDSLNKTNKQAKAVNDSFNKIRINLDLVGKGFSASEQAQLRQLKANGASNAELEKAIELIKKRKQAEVLANYQNQKASLSREWLSAYDKELQSRVAKEKEAAAKIQQIRSDYEAKSRQSLGGGLLDQIGQKNKALSEMAKYYEKQEKEAKKKADAEQKILDDAEAARQKHFSNVQKDYEKQQQAIVDTQKKAIDKQVASQKALNDANQKAITLEQAKAKYVSQGYGKTDSTRLARLEVSGADVATLNNYKSAIEATTRATQALNPAVEKATTNHSNFLGQIKGIAIYAALSAAIYGVMTAMTSLAVSTVKMADEYTAIQNRMKLYITDAKELGKVNNQLAQFSMQNNVGLRETASLFSRLAPSMQKIGANTAAITSVVDAFGKSMRIGGATAMEAASATVQFSQAMASGKLAGDEFRSISEASPRFLQAIADGSGIAAEKLKEMSAAGMLTTEVISKALLNEYPKLIEENKKLGVTLEQGANAIKTGFLVAIGEFNEGAKITEALGESMLDLAQSMFTFAQTAQKTGADVKKWFEENANTIQTVVEVIKLLAVTIVSKYVASMIVAGAISLKTAYSLNVASLGATAVQRAFGLAAIAAIRLGGALSALATPKNLFTLGLTVVGVATSYLLMRDNAAEATQKLVEQNKYVDITTEAYQRLNKEQQLNVRSSIVNDLNDTNKKLDEQASAVENVLKSYAMSRQFSVLGLDKGTKEIINGVTKGVLSYDTALRMLSENSNVPKRIVEDFKKERDIYNDTAKSAIQFSEAAKTVGVDSEISGNKMQNAANQAQSLGNGYSDVGDKAEIASGKVRKFYQDLQADTQKNILAFDLSNKLNISPSTANKVADELSGRAAQEEGLKNKELINQYQKLVKLKADLLAQNAGFKKGAKSSEELDQLKANTAEVLKQQRIYDNMRKSKPYVKVNPNSLLTEEDKKTIKAYDASTSLSSNQTKADKEADKARKKQEADAERLRNANQKVVDTYDNQESTAIRLNEYLKAGVGYSVAKVASEGKYAKVYGDNLETARKIAKARQEVADIEESSKGREDSQNSLMKQFRDQQAISDFMKEGYSYAVAQATVQSGFAVNADGIANANNRTLISLREQLSTSVAEASYQQDLLDFVKSGLSVEEASAQVAIYRNKHLNQGLIITAEKLAKAKQTEQVTKSQLALEQESNSYKEQATYLVQTTKNELADIMAQYKGVSLQEAQTLQTRKDIVEKLREYNDLLEKQKSLSGVLDSTNFEVFGDFGNPFKSALEGLNSLLFGMSDVEAKYQRMGADLTARIDKEKKGSEAQNLLIAQKANLELAHIQESKQARDKAITSGLSLTKSLFKEESKGYKFVSGLEMALQAKKIAFDVWEKRSTIQNTALKVVGYAQDLGLFLSSVATKVAAQLGFNASAGIGAVLSAAQQPGPAAFVGFAAMAALVAGLGIAVSGGGSSGSFAPTNDGTGTVFGDSTAKSESINNSIDLLSENSDLMLPLTSAMLASLRNIESNIGGVTNLVIRNAVGSKLVGGVNQGFNPNTLGKLLSNPTVGVLGGSAMGAMGALAIAGPIGMAIGAILGPTLGKVLGGLFGTKTTVKGQGLFGGAQSLSNIMSNGFDLQEYVDVQTKKKTLGVTTSTKNSTQYASANQELENQFGLIFTGFYDSIISASGALSANTEEVKKKLQDAIINIGKIDLKGLSGEEIQEKLEAVFGAAADSLAQQGFAGLDDFQKVGEGYYETLARVASSVEQASYYTEKLNVQAIKYTDILNKQGDVAAEIVRQSVLLNESTKNIKGGFYDLVNTFNGTAEELTSFIFQLRDLQDQLIMTGKNADYLTSSMILGAGGLDKLSSGFDAYFEMLSPAEQAAELTRRLTKEFALFGEELPANAIAYRDLLNSITDTELATEAGQKLYGQIIALAPEFNDLQDSIKSANSEVNALVQSLRDLAEQARAARGETEQPRNLAFLRNEFESASILAMQGDTEAANRLLTLGKDLMQVSKLYALSGSEYAKDLALIQRAATVSADVQENGLGTSISPTLTPSNGTTTTPTVNTTNTSTDTKLEAIREEFNAGLFAIAKYTQDMASRFERWDDGSRMLVGVQPENGDIPVPVTVVP